MKITRIAKMATCFALKRADSHSQTRMLLTGPKKKGSMLNIRREKYGPEPQAEPFALQYLTEFFREHAFLQNIYSIVNG